MFSCGSWNVNSWTTKNKSFRKNLLSQLNFDIVGIVVSKLKGDSVLELAYYTWFDYNKTDIRRNDTGSGGVGVLVKSDLFSNLRHLCLINVLEIFYLLNLLIRLRI